MSSRGSNRQSPSHLSKVGAGVGGQGKVWGYSEGNGGVNRRADMLRVSSSSFGGAMAIGRWSWSLGISKMQK